MVSPEWSCGRVLCWAVLLSWVTSNPGPGAASTGRVFPGTGLSQGCHEVVTGQSGEESTECTAPGASQELTELWANCATGNSLKIHKMTEKTPRFLCFKLINSILIKPNLQTQAQSPSLPLGGCWGARRSKELPGRGGAEQQPGWAPSRKLLRSGLSIPDGLRASPGSHRSCSPAGAWCSQAARFLLRAPGCCHQQSQQESYK